MTNVELLVENVKRSKADIDEVYNKGYSDGKAEQNNPLDYATGLTRAFIQNTFPENTEFEVSFGNKASSISPYFLEYAFYRATGLKTLKVNCDNELEKVVAMSSFCESNNDTMLETVDISGISNFKPTTINRAFYYRAGLREIIGELNLSECANIGNAFVYCSSLETVRFTPNTIKVNLLIAQSPNLTSETLWSIVNGYADMTGQTAPVISVHPDVKAKIVADDSKEDTDPTKRFWLRTLTSKNVTLA